ncbi:hypothetical protein ACQP1G_37100 [Nocardia sp. CA-107356]|uniref:hypothetical protein n=1 Tax=Nocardia sp. CA-107356 TaxID=3239972 RepID=UPI003D8D58A9
MTKSSEQHPSTPNEEVEEACGCNYRHALHLVKLARSILTLTKQTSVKEKGQLKLIKEVALDLSAALEDYSDCLHSDIGITFIEHIEFKIEDDGTDPTGWTKGYEEQVEEMLAEDIAHLKEHLKESAE